MIDEVEDFDDNDDTDQTDDRARVARAEGSIPSARSFIGVVEVVDDLGSAAMWSQRSCPTSSIDNR